MQSVYGCTSVCLRFIDTRGAIVYSRIMILQVLDVVARNHSYPFNTPYYLVLYYTQAQSSTPLPLLTSVPVLVPALMWAPVLVLVVPVPVLVSAIERRTSMLPVASPARRAARRAHP